MPEAAEIILIDDDISFCDSVKTYFRNKDLQVLTVSDPKLAKALNFHYFRVILLDIDMPDITGIDLLGDIRSSQKPFVIMVSGHNDEQTRLACLSQGADFFFAKPVHLEELSLVAKRALGRTDNTAEGSWTLLSTNTALATPDQRVIGLSAAEYRVMEQLIRHAPNPVSKERLTEVVTGDANQTASFTRALEVMISRLRTRASHGETRLPVKALRNVGYVFHGTASLDS
jgi:two-component system, OmpR family, response regulator